MISVALAFGLIGAGFAASSVPEIKEIWTAGVEYPCYRQPVLLAFEQTVIAFVEARNNTLCWGTKDGYPKYILYKQSTDGGSTFGKTQLVWTGNPDYLGAVRDASTGEIFLFIQEGGSVLLSSSKDGGSTFSKPASWSIPTDYSGFKPSVAHGIQIDGSMCGGDGAAGAGEKQAGSDGRLVMPFVCSGKKGGNKGGVMSAVGGDIKCPGCFSCLVLSDDHGATWRLGAVSTGQEGTREASVAQVCGRAGAGAVAGSRAGAAPQIYLNERNMGATQGHRAWALSTDGGESVSRFGIESTIPSPITHNWTGIVGGLARASTAAGAPLLYTGPTNPDARAQLGVYASQDGAAHWAEPKNLWAAAAGYSDAAALNSSHFAVVFEGGKEHFSEGIFFARVSSEWVS